MADAPDSRQVFGDDGIVRATLYFSDGMYEQAVQTLRSLLSYAFRLAGFGVGLKDLYVKRTNGSFLNHTFHEGGLIRRGRLVSATERYDKSLGPDKMLATKGVLAAGESYDSYEEAFERILVSGRTHSGQGNALLTDLNTAIFPRLDGQFITTVPFVRAAFPTFVAYPHLVEEIAEVFERVSPSKISETIARELVVQSDASLQLDGVRIYDKIPVSEATSRVVPTVIDLAKASGRYVPRPPTASTSVSTGVHTLPAWFDGYRIENSVKEGLVDHLGPSIEKSRMFSALVRGAANRSTKTVKAVLPERFSFGVSRSGATTTTYYLSFGDQVGSFSIKDGHVVFRYGSHVKTQPFQSVVAMSVCEEYAILQALFGVAHVTPLRIRQVIAGTGTFSFRALPLDTVIRIVRDAQAESSASFTDILLEMGFTHEESMRIQASLPDVEFSEASEDVESWRASPVPEMPVSSSLFADLGQLLVPADVPTNYRLAMVRSVADVYASIVINQALAAIRVFKKLGRLSLMTLDSAELTLVNCRSLKISSVTSTRDK
jgi:hypothetical protein